MNGHWEVKDGLHPARFWADISRITLMSVGSHELGPSSVGCSGEHSPPVLPGIGQGTLLVLLDVFCVLSCCPHGG